MTFNNLSSIKTFHLSWAINAINSTYLKDLNHRFHCSSLPHKILSKTIDWLEKCYSFVFIKSFLSEVPFWSSSNIRKHLLMFSGGLKGNLGKNRDNLLCNIPLCFHAFNCCRGEKSGTKYVQFDNFNSCSL